jgi:hypothetical protein
MTVAPSVARPADKRLTTSTPRVGRVLACSPSVASAAAARGHCVSRVLPVGTAIDGRSILSPYDARGRDIAARIRLDACGRTPDGAYIRTASCLDRGSKRAHSRRIGTARDGLAIYGRRDRGGRLLRSRDLDACHGHRHRINGRSVYHYHLTRDFPYAVGCFHLKPKRPAAAVKPPSVPPPAPMPTAPAPTPTPTSTPVRPGDVTFTPALAPAFSHNIPDYAVRCTADTPVEFATTGPATVAIDDGGTARTGSIPLAPGEGFAFTVDDGARSSVHHARCLPANFPRTNFIRPGNPEIEFLITGTTDPGPGYAMIFDTFGVPLWWKHTEEIPLDLRLLDNDELAVAHFIGFGFGVDPRSAFEFRRLDGTLTARYQTIGSPTDGHDMLPLANGNVILATYAPRSGVDLRPYVDDANATVLDTHLQEIRPDGSLAWQWRSEDHMGLNETAHWEIPPTALPDGREVYDMLHFNSLELDGDGLVLSFRHADAIYRIDRATGAIDWKIGGTTTPQSLTVLGDRHSGPHLSGQHDARVLPDGTVTVYENGSFVLRGGRALRLRLDTAARTATIIEDLSDPDTPNSPCCGSARRLLGGNWLVAWGGTARISELEPDGTVTFALGFESGGFRYRAVPLLPGRITREALRAGMDAQARR